MKRNAQTDGQGMVEFALALPVILLLILGVIEAGRLFAIFAMASAASREATRHAAAVGSVSGTPFYLDCTGIRNAAKAGAAALLGLDDSNITIEYDNGDVANKKSFTCDTAPANADDQISNGDRVVITVTFDYSPAAPLIPIPDLPNMTFVSARTIIKEITGAPECSDGLDNDSDGFYDYSGDGDDDGASGSGDDGDPNCVDATDNSEALLPSSSGSCYTVTTAVSPSGAGSVSVDTAQNCTGGYTSGSVVQITASPNSGFDFSSWSGDASGASATTTITMGSDKSVTANFVACYSIITSVSPSGSGAVNVDTAQNCSTGGYTSGTVVQITAAPNSGWGFNNWSGDASGSSTTTTVTLNADKSVTANFVACYTLTTTVTPAGAGTVTPSLVSGSTCSGGYTDGSVVQLDAAPSSGWTFDNWSGDASGTSTTTTVTMDANKNVAGNFSAVAPSCFTVTTSVSPSGAGSVSVDTAQNCSGGYTSGTVVQITAVPNSGWAFNNWSGDASGSSATTTITMDSNKSVTANFVACYTLTTTVTPAGAGTVTPSLVSGSTCSGGYTDGSVVQLDASPNSGFAFVNWSGDASGTSTTTTVTLNANASVTANFAACYTLTTAASPAGGGSVGVSILSGSACSGGYTDGSSLQLSATPNTGFAFDNWSGDASGSSSTYVLTMDGNKSVTANFSASGCQVTAGSIGVGSGSTKKQVFFDLTNNSGTTVTITSISITWPSGNNNLNQINFGIGIEIWDEGASPTSTTISSDWEGPTSNRQLSDGSTKELRFTFQNPAAATGYTITVGVDHPNCSSGITVSN